MSFDYAPILATATRLLTDFGQTCTLVRTLRDGATSTQTGVAVAAKLNEGDRASIGGAEVPARKYLVSGAVTPKAGDILTAGADTGPVMRVDPLKPGATVLIWSVIVRAG
jgi:hypothetical protein